MRRIELNLYKTVLVATIACVSGGAFALLSTPPIPSGREGNRAGWEEEPSGEKTHAVDLAREWYAKRSAGRDSIPLGALVRAKTEIDATRERQHGPRDAGLWTWEWLGPGNVGGRIRAILPHPTNQNRIFVGGVSGGIWRTDDAGASWTPVDDFMASLSVTSLAIDPTNFNVMYAATGEIFTAGGAANYGSAPGAGIFKSTDGGLTWNQLPSTDNPTFKYVSRLAHHPSASNLLYATAFSNSLFRSSDGGGSWFSVMTAGTIPVDVKIQPSNPSRMLLGCSPTQGNQGAVWLSTDGGGVWVEQTTDTNGTTAKLPDTTGRCEVAFGPGDFMYISMNRNGGECWRSTDVGVTWQYRGSVPLGQGEYDNTIWVDPTDPQLVVVGGILARRSTNGGSTWTLIQGGRYADGDAAHADHHAIVAHPGYNGTSNRKVYFGNDGGIQIAPNIATVDTSTAWTNLAHNLGITQFYSGAASPDGSLFVGGTQDNAVPRRDANDGPNGWFLTSAPGDGGYSAIDPNNPDIVYNEYVNLAIDKSTDGGLTYWTSYEGLSDAGTGNALFIAPFRMDPVNSSILLAGGTSIWKTTNAAASWFSVRPPRANSPKCSAIDVLGTEIWVGYTDGTISRSTNGGSSWTDVHAGVPDRWVTDLAISPYFLNEAIVVLAGYNSDNVWITGNGGSNWSRRTGTAPDTLPALQVNTVSYHPTNQDWIYIGTDLGVFASEDFGFNWNTTPHYDGNDGPANVEVTDIFWYSDQMVVATHGRGMFRSRPLDLVYVDKANVGFEDGSPAHPYNTVREGIMASGNGTGLSIKTGTYAEGSNLFDRRGLISPSGGAVVVK